MNRPYRPNGLLPADIGSSLVGLGLKASSQDDGEDMTFVRYGHSASIKDNPELASAEIVRLRAELAAARGTLQQIADYSPGSTIQPVLIARAALQGQRRTE